MYSLNEKCDPQNMKTGAECHSMGKLLPSFISMVSSTKTNNHEKEREDMLNTSTTAHVSRAGDSRGPIRTMYM